MQVDYVRRCKSCSKVIDDIYNFHEYVYRINTIIDNKPNVLFFCCWHCYRKYKKEHAKEKNNTVKGG